MIDKTIFLKKIIKPAVIFSLAVSCESIGSDQADAQKFYEDLNSNKSLSATEVTKAEKTSQKVGVKGNYKGIKFKQTAGTLNNYPGKMNMVFDELPLTAIEPKGWLRTWLEDQANGLTGNIQVAGYPFDTQMWACEAISNGKKRGDWAQYEQTAFYIDGLFRVALLLKDEKLTNRAVEQMEYVLSHADPNGILGPSHVKSRWPRANFFRTMRAFYNASGDPNIIKALVKHFKADTSISDNEEFGRSSVMIETLVWLYQVTGDSQFIETAIASKKSFDKTSSGHACSTAIMLSETMPHVHGAMYAEMVHLPAMLYMCTGEPNWLNASVNGYKKIFQYHGLPDGIFSSEEGTNGNGPRNIHETCAIADFSYNTGYMLMATGECKWADMIERSVLNAGTSIVTNNFRALQYFSGPNLLLSDLWSSYVDAPSEKDPNLTHFSRDRMCYRPGSSVACCSGSVHRIIPAYISRMWLTDNKGGIAASLYGASKVNILAGKEQKPVIIDEKTDFPFSDTIELQISAKEPVRFTLYLRIPEWSDKAKLAINGQTENINVSRNGFIAINREFCNSDRIVLTLPMKLKMTLWPENGVAIERGPLVYSLSIKEKRQSQAYVPWESLTQKFDPNFPQWIITPASAWNYAFAFKANELEKQAIISTKPIGDRPWESGNAPIEIKLPCKLQPKWDYLRIPKKNMRRWTHDDISKMPEVFVFTPGLPEKVDCSQPTEYLSFVPYGSSCLRMTILPNCINE